MIYLDNSATSPIDKEVFEAMLPYLQEEYGNPSSKYYLKAVNAKNAVEEARENLAKLINAKPEEVIFTAGATESSNMIIKGYLDYRKYYGDGKNHIITTSVEHKATLNICKYLNGEIYSNNDPSTNLFGIKKRIDRGFKATFVGVDSYGAVLTEQLQDSIKENTAIISCIHVNNEVGTVNDIQLLAKMAHENGLVFHSDITQSLGKMPIDVVELGCDYASCSAHKIYGPKGIGAAYLKADNYGIKPISAFIHGGEQEQGVRAGTLAVHNIVGFGKAAEIALRNHEYDKKRIEELDYKLVSKINQLDNIRLTNPSENRIPGIVSIIVDKTDFNNERFLKEVSDEFALSTGSACSLGEPSHVLSAMGLGDKTNNVIRISINKQTDINDIEKLIRVLNEL